MRGARVAPRDLVDPRSWSDHFHCLLVPVVVRAFVAVEEAALSVQSRSFEGIHHKHTDSGEDQLHDLLIAIDDTDNTTSIGTGITSMKGPILGSA